MSLAEIEAELEKLTPDELRRIALKSWNVFVQKERGAQPANECNEDDAALLTSLDESVIQADASPGHGHSANAVRQKLRKWTSR